MCHTSFPSFFFSIPESSARPCAGYLPAILLLSRDTLFQDLLLLLPSALLLLLILLSLSPRVVPSAFLAHSFLARDAAFPLFRAYRRPFRPRYISRIIATRFRFASSSFFFFSYPRHARFVRPRDAKTLTWFTRNVAAL